MIYRVTNIFFLAYFLQLLTVGSNKNLWAVRLKECETTWEVWSQLTLSNMRDISLSVGKELLADVFKKLPRSL